MGLVYIFNLVDLSNANVPKLTLESFMMLDLRIEFYINTIRIIKENVLLGVGLGDFEKAYQIYIRTYDLYTTSTDNPHNEYLMIWVQSGIFGLLLFLWIHLEIFRRARELSEESSSLATATLITIICACLFNSSFLDTNDGALLTILVALFLQPTKQGV